jgi:hypothetical protein
LSYLKTLTYSGAYGIFSSLIRLEKLAGNSLSVYLSLSSISALYLNDPPSYFYLCGPDIASGVQSEDFKTINNSGCISMCLNCLFILTLFFFLSVNTLLAISHFF